MVINCAVWKKKIEEKRREQLTQFNSLNPQLWNQNENIIFFVLHVLSTLYGPTAVESRGSGAGRTCLQEERPRDGWLGQPASNGSRWHLCIITF